MKGLHCMLGCNLKALAIFRITLSLLLLCELILRFRYLEAFYSDEGTLPLYLLLEKVDPLYKVICVHCLHGSVLYQGALLSIQVVLALSLLVGYRCKTSALLSWWLYFSSTLRNTWLAFILDRYFHFTLFYLAFLPVGEMFSLDSSWNQAKDGSLSLVSKNKHNDIVFNFATAVIKLQILWIYLDAGSGKYMDPLGGWTFNADPLPALDTYTRHTVPARYMYALLGPFGMRLLTPVVVWVELLCAPICLIGSYFMYDKVVLSMIAVICFLHIGIAFTLRNTVLLSLVACATWCVYIPQSWFSNRNNEDHREARVSWTGETSVVKAFLSLSCTISLLSGCLWFGTMSDECTQSVDHIYSNLLHNRWNVFVGAEEYVTWEIAPGRLVDGSVVDIWSMKDEVDWSMPDSGTPCTSTVRHGRWRSFPYLAELDGKDGEVLWGYLCKQWNKEHPPERRLLRYNFFMLQADVLPNMGFSATRKRLIHSHVCSPTEDDVEESVEIFSEIAIEEL